MSNGSVVPARPGTLATLVRTLSVRVLEVSQGGCRIESSHRLIEGASGRLRVSLDGRIHQDDVRVSRCARREGAGQTYVIGAELLHTRPLNSKSLRLAISRLIGRQVETQPPPPASSLGTAAECELEPAEKGGSRAPP